MEKADFDKLKNTKNPLLGDKNLGKFSSWAIWEKKDINKFIEANLHDLKGDIVFVGLNFGEEVKPWQDWQNFYGVERLINLLSSPEAKDKFKGAYMTDIIKNYHEPNSREALKFIKDKKNEDFRNQNIDFFFEEIEMLKAPTIEMYLFGAAVEEVFRKYVMKAYRL
jgi:hypothetical protein